MNPAHREAIVDDYHGMLVADPYRWLEDPDTPETQAWVAARNEQTAAFLSDVPARARIRERLTELWNFPRNGVPRRFGDRLFFSRNDGLQNQAVLYRRDGLDGEPEVVIDPNTLSDDGTIALTVQAFSHDGTLLTYGTSQSGSDWQELRVRTIASSSDGDEVIRWCRFASVGWKHDNSGFYYDRFPEPGSVPEEDTSNYSRVYWHRAGTPQADDVLIHEEPERKELGFSPFVTDDGARLFLYVYRGTSPKTGLYYRPIESEDPFIRLLDVDEAHYEPIEVIGSVLYLQTDLDAPRGRIVAIDLENPARERWREVVPESEAVIDFVAMVADQLVVVTMRDAHHEVARYATDGTLLGAIPLPTLGAIAGLSGKRGDGDLFLAFTSYLYPTTILRYDFASDTLAPFFPAASRFDAAPYETTQVFYHSKDGTRVPMFLTHRKGLPLDGRNPTLLYGYGGFNVSLTPGFAISPLLWLEQGGIFAVANLRGGGEYGKAWHEAGMREHKQNVFDDFIAAAEWLIEQGYTGTPRLAIQGGSNGGLLVAACMLQRPELFGAVICQVPVTDMLRYHRFTVGRYWVPEYGNAEEDPEAFRYLYAYSPLHHTVLGTAYPPTLITTADTDNRVAPLHAKKFTAALQAAQGGDNPILLRVETRAGHGAGKPTTKVIEEQSDTHAFLSRVLGLEGDTE